eukprot:68970-Hanusia_phi.AAC.1
MAASMIRTQCLRLGPSTPAPESWAPSMQCLSHSRFRRESGPAKASSRGCPCTVPPSLALRQAPPGIPSELLCGDPVLWDLPARLLHQAVHRKL